MNMINAKELRIGNNIMEYRFDFEKGQMADVIVDVTATTITQASLNTNNLFPIKLTEDILIKCGFKDMSFPGYKPEYTLLSDELNLATIEYDSEMNAVWLCFEGTICGRKLKYLHQLQNLYFALTGEELNVELNAQVSDTTKPPKE